MNNRLNICIGKDSQGWHSKFLDAVKKHPMYAERISAQVANLESDKWLEPVQQSDIVIWKPSYMGVKAAAQFQSKIYFIEKYCHKTIVPNYNTIWHFENKIAQYYLLASVATKMPKTAVSFDYSDAMSLVEKMTFPAVYKDPSGAGSNNVSLVRNKGKAEKIIKSNFAQQLWLGSKMGSKWASMLLNIYKPWLWKYFARKLLNIEQLQAVYFQEFIPGNSSDLRITAIGDRFAFGFWRNNRPGDFRASGSGSLDYVKPVPETAVRYCLELNKKLGFDSMAYDILFTKDDFVISEISYGYLDTAIYNAPGYYHLDSSGNLSFKKGHYWPHELWVNWALIKSGLGS